MRDEQIAIDNPQCPYSRFRPNLGMTNHLPIAIERCQFSAVGMRIDGKLTIPEWQEIGRKLDRVKTCYQFFLGDWLNYGERHYGQTYRIACAETGLDYGTLRNYASVCNAIDLSRRRDSLTFSHHIEVSKLPADEQEKWLEIAEASKWSVMTLRAAIRDDGAVHLNEDHGKPVRTLLSIITHASREITGLDSAAMTPEQRLQCKDLLKPLVEFYERL